MEEKLRKIFNFSPPTTSPLSQSPPPTRTTRALSTDKIVEPTNNNAETQIKHQLSQIEQMQIQLQQTKQEQDLREQIIRQKEEALERREYDISVLEKEIQLKMEDIMRTDNELKIKLSTISKRGMELEETIREFEKKKLEKEREYAESQRARSELKRSADFIVVDSASPQKAKPVVLESPPPLLEDDMVNDQEEWIVVTGDGLEPVAPSSSMFSGLRNKITQNFKCSVAECNRVIFVFEPKHKCIRCGNLFCLEHSSCITQLVNVGSVLKSSKSDEISGFCATCAEFEIQTIGPTRDLGVAFSTARQSARENREKKYHDHEELVRSSIRSAAETSFPPAAAFSNALKNNPIKNIVLSAKETWNSCPYCGSFFERLSVKQVCRLCNTALCEQCGTRPVEFSPLQLFSHVIPSQSSTIPRWQTVVLESCSRCRDLVDFRQRSFDFLQNISKRRSLSAHLSKQISIYTNLSAMYVDLSSKLERFKEIVEKPGDINKKEVEEVQDSLEEFLGKFQDNVRLLHNYNRNTNETGLRSSAEVSPTEFRVLENTKIFFKRELREAVLSFQKYKQVYHIRDVQTNVPPKQVRD